MKVQDGVGTGNMQALEENPGVKQVKPHQNRRKISGGDKGTEGEEGGMG